jgi:hypothetical protein
MCQTTTIGRFWTNQRAAANFCTARFFRSLPD